MAADLVSRLKWEELFKAADHGDPRVKDLAGTLDQITGIDFKKEGSQISAVSEQPFLPPDLWALFSAYQNVIIHSVLRLKVAALGTTKYLEQEDKLKPVMLLALPEYKSYIEQYGFSGYYHLLDILEQKLLGAIAAMLDGKDVDYVALKHAADIMAAVRVLNTEKKPDIPDSFRGPHVPDPEPEL
jgi:hypothetical protein